MSHFQEIYRRRGADYERLVAREDYQGNLPATLERLAELEGASIVEIGAGTGRLIRQFASQAKWMVAADGSEHMLRVAAECLEAESLPGGRLVVADNGTLPWATSTADIGMAGWTLGHSVDWYPHSWRLEIGRALAELRRVVRPGGRIIILETLGTNQSEPAPPTPGLATFYRWLEDEHGFQREWLRTDYRFASLAEALALTSFFFGPEMATAVADRGTVVVPECTGLWWREN